MKSFLMREQLKKDPNSQCDIFKEMSIFDEFNLTKNDAKNLLKHGAELWMTLKKIH